MEPYVFDEYFVILVDSLCLVKQWARASSAAQGMAHALPAELWLNASHDVNSTIQNYTADPRKLSASSAHLFTNSVQARIAAGSL